MIRCIGCDVGTGNITLCEKNDKGTLDYYKEKDAFFKINTDAFMEGGALQFGEKMLKKTGANYVKIDENMFILGDSAFKFANLFHSESLRPMAKGVLNPNEPESAMMIKELIRGLCGNAKSPEDILYFCVPANPIDANFDNVYHADVLRKIFQELGYKNIFKMTEGLAIIYSELEAEMYTGIAISFGAGMMNICYSHLGIPVFSFSLSRSGDYIDLSAAKAVNETSNQVQMIKERGMDVNVPKNNAEKAIASYYENLLTYLVTNFIKLYESTDKKTLPNITEPITIVLAGGTSLVGGFKEMFENRIKEKFPIPVKEVRMAKDPLFAVVTGLYNAAEIASEKK